MNDWSLTIIDTSVYTPLIPVSCPSLQVMLPGFTTATLFNENSVPALEPAFIRNFTACNLEAQFTDCGTQFNCLPDGIYVIKYSVSPNTIVYVEYNHLRIVLAMQQYQALICDLNLSDCSPIGDNLVRYNELMDIKNYLDAAVNAAEWCNNPKKAMVLYNYALKRLKKLKCLNC
jgi:hypothetical protein